MVSTLGLGKVGVGGGVHFKNSCRQGGVGLQFSYEIIFAGYTFIHHTFLKTPIPPGDVINDRSLKAIKEGLNSLHY